MGVSTYLIHPYSLRALDVLYTVLYYALLSFFLLLLLLLLLSATTSPVDLGQFFCQRRDELEC